MQIKPFYRLRPADLPLVESPFLASQTLRRTLSDPFASRSSLILDDIPGILPGGQREVVHRYLLDRVVSGELCLVCSGVGSDRPVSPVIAWQHDSKDESSGTWYPQEGGYLIPGLKDSTEQLNRSGLTPRDLKLSGAVGSLTHVGTFTDGWREPDGQTDSQPDHHLSLPLGASASVEPLATGAGNRTSEDRSQGVHVVAGLFTDGTLNNVDNIEIFRRKLQEECIEPLRKDLARLEECRTRLGMRLGESYANGPTNVVKLFDLYQEQKDIEGGRKTLTLKAYEAGAGTKSGEKDSILGAATGLGETGVPEQVKRLFRALAELAKVRLGGDFISELSLDLFGFSRGAAAARHAAHQILKGADGQLAEAFRGQGLKWPDKVSIRFVGLFDTVAGIVNFSSLDLSAGNDQNDPVELYLDPDKVGHVVHLVAADEKRTNFALNSVKSTDGSLPANFREIVLPGAHSDVGGGYPDLQTEELLLHPTLTIRGSETRWPQQTMEWDNLESLRSAVESENWIGPHSLPLSDGARPYLRLEEKRDEHPLPDGRVELSLRMTRRVSGKYSRIPMRIMHALARDVGVPLKIIPDREDLNLPSELEPVERVFISAVASGKNLLSFDVERSALIRQRYTHHSNHFNALEWLAGEQIVRLEVPAQEFIHPMRPTLSKERAMHFNERSG